MMCCSEYHVKISEAIKRVKFVNHLNNYQLHKYDYEFVVLSKLITLITYL